MTLCYLYCVSCIIVKRMKDLIYINCHNNYNALIYYNPDLYS